MWKQLLRQRASAFREMVLPKAEPRRLPGSEWHEHGGTRGIAVSCTINFEPNTGMWGGLTRDQLPTAVYMGYYMNE